MSTVLDDPRSKLDARDIRPIVSLPRGGLSGAGIAAICAVLGLVLFFTLNANRRAMSTPRNDWTAKTSAIASPPPLIVPPEPASFDQPAATPMSPVLHQPVRAMLIQPSAPAAAPAPSPHYPPPPPIPMATVQSAPAGGSGDQLIVMDLGRGEAPGVRAAGEEAAKGDTGAGDDQAVRATLIRGRASLVPQGTLIPAVLETPIDSARGGLVRALVSRDVRGFDGSRVLIPRGSRLLGEAKGDAQPGQRRVLVTWSRLIRPDGVAVRIGSPGADNLGGAGLKGQVNTHFLERFANAVLQSALTVGVNLASRPRDGSVIVGLPTQLGGAAAQMPLFNVPNGPTIKVGKGAEIAVFVARDLDFGGTPLVQ